MTIAPAAVCYACAPLAAAAAGSVPTPVARPLRSCPRAHEAVPPPPRRSGRSTGAPLCSRDDAHAGAIRALAFSADGRLLLTAGDDKHTRLWDTASWQCARTL